MTTAVVVIDVQAGLFGADGPYGAPFEAVEVVARINTVVRVARKAGAPVVWVQHERAQGFLAHGTPDWQLCADLEADPSDTRVRKTTPDSFLRTDLHAHLERLGVRRLIVCGYASEFCVDTTTRRAAALGYPVTLVADAHTTHDKPHAAAEQIRAHENATLPNLTSFGVVIQAVVTDQLTWTA